MKSDVIDEIHGLLTLATYFTNWFIDDLYILFFFSYSIQYRLRRYVDDAFIGIQLFFIFLLRCVVSGCDVDLLMAILISILFSLES